MRTGTAFAAMVVLTSLSILPVRSAAQNAAKPAASAQAPGRGGRAPDFEIQATVLQLMRGTLYPASNLIFFAQSTNPNDVAPEKDPSAAVNPLASAYGKWQAVENASLAMYETANLLLLPGRKCANGKPAPIGNPDWPKFVQGLREASLVAYKAAQAKDQDKILDASDKLTTACGNCHDKWREKPSLADRCQ